MSDGHSLWMWSTNGFVDCKWVLVNEIQFFCFDGSFIASGLAQKPLMAHHQLTESAWRGVAWPICHLRLSLSSQFCSFYCCLRSEIQPKSQRKSGKYFVREPALSETPILGRHCRLFFVLGKVRLFPCPGAFPSLPVAYPRGVAVNPPSSPPTISQQNHQSQLLIWGKTFFE